MQNFCYENEFDLHENELIEETHFHMNGFARRLILARSAKDNSEMAYFQHFTGQFHFKSSIFCDHCTAELINS